MKRLLILGFTFIYTVLATGVAFSIHYCRGEIADVCIAGSKENVTCCSTASCCSTGTEKDLPCCEDEFVFVQFNATQIATSINRFNVEYSYPAILSTLGQFDNEVEWVNNSEKSCIISDNISPPLWLLHCNFTFYG